MHGALGRPLIASLVLLLVYAALALANDPRGTLGTDTGGKLATLHAMVDGDLDPDIGYWAERHDADGDLHPLALTRYIEGRWLSVTTLPMLYAAVPLYEIGGLRAIVLLPMIGGVLTALAARALARRLGSGNGTAAFWAVGLATPVAVYALDFWEHSLGLAAMLWGVVVLLDVTQGRAGANGALAGGALFGIAATMRTEALVYAAVAVGVTAVATWVRRRSLVSTARVGVFAVAGLIVPLVLNVVVEQAVLGTAFRAARSGSALSSGGGGGGDRIEEALTTTVGLNHLRPTVDWFVGGLVAALVGVAIVLWLAPARHRRRLGGYAFAAAVLVYVVRLGDGLGFLPGLLTASPLAVAGLAVAMRRRSFCPVMAMALLALPLVWFFQYSGGANPQWGGRYVLLSGAVLATLAALALTTMPHAARVAIVGLSAVVTLSGVAWLSSRSHAVADAMRTIAGARGAVVSAEFHLLREGGAFYNPSRPWLTAPYPQDLPRAVDVVEAAGFERLTIVGRERGNRSVGEYQRTGTRTIEFLPGFEVVLTSYQRT